MKYNLPPLTCLPAFEAAARYNSFTKAADELCVTQAAISFQVRNLEKSLSVRLFVRHHRTLELTSKGQLLFTAIQTAFTSLEDVKAIITGAIPSDTITITAPISFCGKWLVPRLHRLYSAVPNINLRIDANDTVLDINNYGIEIAIRYCASPPDGAMVQPLLDDVVFPVWSPHVDHSITSLSDLSDCKLLYDQMTDYTWQDWFKTVEGLQNSVVADIGFSHTANAIDAAIAGQGVALGRSALVADDLESGRLMRLSEKTGQAKFGYYMVQADAVGTNAKVDAVAGWLLNEAKTTTKALFT